MIRTTHLSRLLCLSLALLRPCPALAQDAPYLAVVDRFFELVQDGETDDAVAFLYSSNPWMARSADAVEQVRSRLGDLPGVVGQLRHRELLQRKELGTRFVYLSYLAAYDRQPIRFIFEFYKADEAWMTFGFSFDQDLDDDVEGRARQELGGPP